MDKKQIGIIITFLIYTLTLVGCNAKPELEAKFPTDALSSLDNRIDQNRIMAKKFGDIGVLSPEDVTKITENLDAQANKIKAMSSDGHAFINYIAGSTRRVKTPTSSDHPESLRLATGEDIGEVELTWDGSGWKYLADNNVEVEALGKKLNNVRVSLGNNGDTSNTDPSNLPHSAFINSSYIRYSEAKTYDWTTSGNVHYRPNDVDVSYIPLIDTQIGGRINKDIAKIEVFVLKPDLVAQYDNDIEGLMANVQKGIAEHEAGNTDHDYLSDFFEEAIDVATGKKIYLIDSNNTVWDMVGTTKDWDTSMNYGEADEERDINLGYDLVMDHGDGFYDTVHIKLYEFSNSAYKLYKELFTGDGFSRYYIVSNSGGGMRAYLIEYPLYVIDRMANSETDPKAVECTFRLSGLGVNLLENCYVKYKVSDVSEETGNVIFDTSEAYTIGRDDTNGFYLTLDENDNNDESSNTSIVLKGYTANQIRTVKGNDSASVKNDINNGLSDKDNSVAYNVLTGRLILRDYLEATFAPGFQQDETSENYGENLVAFGRKIRFDMKDSRWQDEEEFMTVGGKETNYKNKKLVYSKTDTNVACFVDQSGAKIPTSPDLAITEFCDISLLRDKNYNNCKVAVLNPVGERGTIVPGKEIDKTVEGVPEIDNIDKVIIDYDYNTDDKNTYIVSTDVFPSPYIDEHDFNNEQKDTQRMYAIATQSGLLKTSLYSSWINSNSSTGSLQWWNNYLENNGLHYKIDENTVNNYVNSNYGLNGGTSDAFVMNMNTLDTINEINRKEDNENRVRLIKTIFVVGGWLLIIYSAILMLLWTIDVNAGLGVQLLQKATFGHWVAVKYPEDIPHQDANGTKYMLFGKMVVRCLVMILMGLILIYVNMFWIVLELIEKFGVLGKSIENIINGMH